MLRFRQFTPELHLAQSRAMSYNCGVFARERRAVIIDPGVFPDELASVRDFVAGQECTIVLTHSHWDHVLGPAAFPGVPVVAHRDFPCRVEESLAELGRWEEEHDIRRDPPFVMPTPDIRFDSALTLDAGGTELQLRHAPGHWPGQLVICHEEFGLLWAGDLLSDIEIPFVSHSLAAYEATLARLAELDVRVLVPGHGNPTDDPREIARRFVADRAYLAELRAAVGQRLRSGGLPERRRAAMLEGFTPTAQLATNLYPHCLNFETAWLELGGEPMPGRAGWGAG